MDKKAEIKSADMKALSEYRKYLRENLRLTYLFVEQTDACNLKCLHCGSNCGDGRRTFIDTDLAVMIKVSQVILLNCGDEG